MNNLLQIRSGFRKRLTVKMVLIGIFILINISLQAQGKGMQFIHNSSWKTILEKAKAENKYIFVDCFTTWCGPCKYMSVNVFPLEEVGNFYNSKFINVGIQIDSTASDNAEVRALYADASFINKEYHIIAYPTYLFFNPKGELVHRELGSSEATKFISKGENALDPQKQYYTQVRKYESGQRDSAFLRNLTLLALYADDDSGISKYSHSYFLLNPNLLTKDNMELIYETTRSAKDTGFHLMLNNLSLFESVVPKQELHRALTWLILRSEYYNYKIEWEKLDKKEWENFENTLSKKYPLYADEVLVQIETTTYAFKKDWASYVDVVGNFIKRQTPSNENLNNYAWTLFQQCNDKAILEKALGWSKMSFTNQAKVEPGFIDTYANLLYKLGRKEEALEWETKAQKIAIEQGNEKNWGQDVIDKMNKGEKTW